MTDGESLVDPELTLPEAEAARAENIILYTIGIGSNLNLNLPELQGIASDPDSDHLAFVETFDQLLHSIEEISVATCQVASTGKVHWYFPKVVSPIWWLKL